MTFIPFLSTDVLMNGVMSVYNVCLWCVHCACVCVCERARKRASECVCAAWKRRKSGETTLIVFRLIHTIHQPALTFELILSRSADCNWMKRIEQSRYTQI